MPLDLTALREAAWHREIIPEQTISELLWYAQGILSSEPNILNVSAPVNVCGDVHGQFYDVRLLFSKGGPLPEKKYLFLGDLVDRGYFSLETVTLLFIYKCLYPDRIYLIRGNHECRAITQVYGFYEECMRKYGHSGIWKLFVDSFDFLPIAAVVDNRIFCVHGGLSPKCPTLDSIRTLQRSMEIPPDGPFCDLVWSDPDIHTPLYSQSARGAGYLFGSEAVRKFINDNGIQFVARAHQLAAQGFNWLFHNTCVTVWSAPNYFYKCKNLASIMKVDDNGNQAFEQFEAVPEREREKPPMARR